MYAFSGLQLGKLAGQQAKRFYSENTRNVRVPDERGGSEDHHTMVTAMQSSGSLSTSSSLPIATSTEPLNWSGHKANGRPKSAAYFYSTLVTPLFRRHAESGIGGRAMIWT
jgi:hypothetical protein